jgi:hypothetical protein
MRKVTLLAAAIAAVVLIGIETWMGVRTLTPTSAIAGSTAHPSTMMTGAKGPLTSHYDDYSLVFY